jgi:hypothetical protein
MPQRQTAASQAISQANIAEGGQERQTIQIDFKSGLLAEIIN